MHFVFLRQGACGVNVPDRWEPCAHDPLQGFLVLRCTAAIPGCNAPCEDEDCSGHAGFPGAPEEVKALVGLCNCS